MSNALEAGFLCATVLALVLTGSAGAQQQEPTSTPEVFEKTDPYTKGKPEAFDKAGYSSLGPFTFAQDVTTAEIEEVLGGVRVLWVETAHFKLGSLLQTYRRGTDDEEEKRLAAELTRLARKLPRVRKDARELDPWLRLHLYAQRLEDLYADFQSTVGVTEADFAPKASGSTGASTEAAAFARGPHLGQAAKFTVLLTERRAQLDRFARRWVGPAEAVWYFVMLPGGSRFVGITAETMREAEATLDSALHAFVVTGVAYNLCDALCGERATWPTWLRHGLALGCGRKAEPRWSLSIARESPGPEDSTWRWEERLNGLVTNHFTATFEEMFLWTGVSTLEARHHMTAWSRVSWLLELDRAAGRKCLQEWSRPFDSERDATAAVRTAVDRQKAVLQTAYGKTLAELDEAWRKFVLRKYPKK